MSDIRGATELTTAELIEEPRFPHPKISGSPPPLPRSASSPPTDLAPDFQGPLLYNPDFIVPTLFKPSHTIEKPEGASSQKFPVRPSVYT